MRQRNLKNRIKVTIMQENRKQVRTVQEEMARERKYWKQNQVWALVLAAVVLLNLLGGSGVSIAPGPESLTLTMHDGSAVVVEYDTVTSVQLLEKPDCGTVAEGKETRTGRSGTWEHPEWGSYTLCAYASCDRVVRITTEAGSYVMNLASEEETHQLYQLIQDKMPASR